MLHFHYQPIVSLRSKSLVGAEALVRHVDPSGTPLSPVQLFSQAHSYGKTLELDRLCRKRAMLGYAKLPQENGRRPLLFVNFEASVIDQGVEGSNAILEAMNAAGLLPENIVLEINESKVRDRLALQRFVERHRYLGFMIALDDLGAGESNLPRIAELKPQILKLDRELVRDIDKDFIKQETFKCLVSLGRRIGAIILAEGVETEAETDACAALGAELFQGYYFARPAPAQDLLPQALNTALTLSAARQRQQAVLAMQSRRAEGQRLRRISEAGSNVLAQSDPTGYSTVLKRLVSGNLAMECAYLLDRDGIQITETITHENMKRPRQRLFAPAPRGADHSNKEYFFSLMDAGLERYTTSTYLSLATGELCRTVSCLVPRKDGSKLILCLDLHVEA
jgi:EAL domain-containing protein (putative c-di-GMP-specific phosphodiesterase class I)